MTTHATTHTTAPATAADPRVRYAQALAQTAGVIAAIRPDQLTAPTPCAEYDVRALLGHLVGGLHRVAITGEGGDGLAHAARMDGVPDDGWSAAFEEARTRVTAAWADDATLDAMLNVPWGTVPGRGAVAGYTLEVLTHGWDLAVATGQETEPDQELGEYVLGIARRILQPGHRGEGSHFGDAQDVPGDAGAYARLAAWTGRRP